MAKLNRTGRKDGIKKKPKVELGADEVTSEIQQLIIQAKARDKGKVAIHVDSKTIVLVSPKKAAADYQNYNTKLSRP